MELGPRWMKLGPRWMKIGSRRMDDILMDEDGFIGGGGALAVHLSNFVLILHREVGDVYF
eukprot:8545040-Pyramimonas_sp.AAC.1